MSALAGALLFSRLWPKGQPPRVALPARAYFERRKREGGFANLSGAALCWGFSGGFSVGGLGMGDVDLVIVCAGLAAAKVLRAAGVSFARRRIWAQIISPRRGLAP